MSYGELEANLVRENRELREQNRVLREALQQVAKWDVRSQSQSVQSFAQAALTATSQPGGEG